jgi:hypothetical protein
MEEFVEEVVWVGTDEPNKVLDIVVVEQSSVTTALGFIRDNITG